MTDHKKYMKLLELYRRLANGEHEVTFELVAMEKELGFRPASPAADIENLHRRINALERENTLLSIIGGGIQRCR